MADSGGNWWSAFWPGFMTIAGSILTFAGTKLWSGMMTARSEEAREQKQDEKMRRDLLRKIDGRASEELSKAWERIDALGRENDVLRARCTLWEARARRVDELAHNIRHLFANDLHQRQVEGPPIPRIPLLEDPL